MTSLDRDSQLDRAMDVEGYKVLPPCVLYGKIGQGGMGAVYRGRHLNLDIDVAVKCLRPGLVESDDQFVVRFRREARAAAQINHQNVIRVFDVAEEKGLHYIVMELVQGETARERVLRKKSLQVGEALEIIHGAAKGLGEAHRKGFIHRDIKPDNIMISSSGQVKVADLGLAKPAMAEDQASLLSGTNLVMGTPQYMPPEQWENTSNVTPAADVWALGATLYYLLVGVEAIAKDSLPRIMQRIVMQPFPDVRKARPDVPADVAALIARATQTLPGARYQDAQELTEALEQLATRRQALTDRDAAPTTQQHTLLSPPPAKTLAKIKFWLDEHGQRAAPPAAATTTTTGQTGTVAVSPVPARTKVAAWPWLLVVALLGVAAAVLWWQPWRSQLDPLAAATRFEKAAQYAAALAEVERVYTENPSLPGKGECVARLRAASALQLAEQSRYREAAAELELSLAANDSVAGRDQQRQLFARIDRAVAESFRPTPQTQDAPRQGKIEVRGRITTELADQLTVGGELAALAPDGSFRVEVDPRGLDRVAASARLWSGRTVELAPVPVRYEALPAAALPLSVQPKELELVDDQEQILTVRLPRGAELRIDGVAVERTGAEDIYLHPVRSSLDQPMPIQLVAHQQGFVDSSLQVPVRRRAASLTFARPAQFVEAKKVGDALVTGADRVQVRGVLNERADNVLVNGVPLADLQWGDKGVFQGAVAISPGENELRLVAQKRFRQPTAEVLRITRLLPPTIAALEPAATGASVDAPSCVLVVRADAATVRVGARCGTANASLLRDATGDLYRGRIALAPGSNVIVVEATNAIDLRSKLELRVERTGASAAPVINAVGLVIGERIVDVARNSEVFLREVAQLRIDASDPGSTVTVNGEAVQCVADALQFDLAPRLKAGADLVLELRVSNAVGRSEAFRCKIVFDTTPPEVEVAALTTPIAKGQAFELRGRWADPSGLQSVRVGDLAGEMTPGRGVARRGEWSVRMAPLAATSEITLVVEDRAGNRTTLPVRIEVR